MSEQLQQSDKRPHQVVPTLQLAPSGAKWSSCYPNGELRYIGASAKKGYQTGRIYNVGVHITQVSDWHPFANKNGQVTVYDHRETNYQSEKLYQNFEEFCKEWENPD